MGALTVAIAAAPSLLLVAYFYLRDRYEREPLGHIALAYGLGMFAMFAAQGLSSNIEGRVSAEWLQSDTEAARAFDAFVLAGLLEELSKWVVLMAAVYPWRELDEPLDGLVYGVTVALGFAALENLHYIERFGLSVAWPRAVFAVPAHALFGGTMGYYAGCLKFDRVSTGTSRRVRIDRVLCLGLPSLFHGAYNFALHHGLGAKVWAAITILSLALWRFVLRRVHRAQRASPYRPKTMPPSRPRTPHG